MITLKKLEQVLKEKYRMCVGELAIRELKKKLVNIPKIKVKGRSYITGRKKSFNIGISDFLR